MEPYRIKWNSHGIRTPEVTEAQMRTNIASGWPMLQYQEPHKIPLAVVGGGPSAAEHLDELKEWKGDIWAINQTASWLSHFAPKANVYLFTIDPDECLSQPQFINGVQKAILSSACHPSVFEALRGKEVRMFHCRRLPDVEVDCLGGGRCSGARTPMQAALLGYMSVTYYGCEGSLGKTTHAYRHEHRPNQLVIRAAGEDYVTTPDLYMNTEDLVAEFREYPKVLKEKSGGLLRAMLTYPDDWEIVALSSSLRDRLDPTATEKYELRTA